jgi:hypothetical protein
MQLLANLKEKRGYRKLKEEALDRTVWRVCFGRSYRPVVRQTIELMNVFSYSTAPNPCQLRSLAAMLSLQIGGCRHPFAHGMKGLIVYERVCLDVTFDTENFWAIIRATCISFGHG